MDAAATGREVESAKEPVLKLNFLSHGTLECHDIAKTKRFYTDFLGLEVVQTSPISLMIRLGGTNTIATVQSARKQKMPMLNHNGLDVETRAAVDESHRKVAEGAAQWGISKVTRPADQHGTYSFYFCDLDDNWWEILANPQGGYSWMFAKGGDIDNWGAGEAQGFNPNDYTRRRFPAR
jgi:catechol 2,3-dioxygenase-like lactoylglutathione lyase family enzyme